MRRARKDTRMNSGGSREGPIKNTYVQSPTFCARPLTVGILSKRLFLDSFFIFKCFSFGSQIKKNCTL